MGLSVGVVSIDYLYEPQPPVSDFLKRLALNPNLESGNDGDYWGGGWGGNSFLEFELSVLMARAHSWCNERDINASEQIALITWLSSLPWRDGYVMLHLS